jgi:hypothetical protein
MVVDEALSYQLSAPESEILADGGGLTTDSFPELFPVDIQERFDDILPPRSQPGVSVPAVSTTIHESNQQSRAITPVV